MEVSYYALVNDISLLFKYPIIVYGAGNAGGRIVRLLEQVCADVHCFFDMDINKKEYLGYEVINIEQLRKVIKEKQYNIVLASDIYYEEMLLQLEQENIYAKYVFTSWGVESGLIWNLNDKKVVSFAFKEYEKREIDKILDYQREHVAVNGLRTVLSDKPEVLIYQIGKVGSMTVYESLKNKNINCMQVHVLCDYDESEEGKILEQQYQNEIKENGIKIISLVRDPIARFVSAKLQGSNFACWAINSNGRKIKERCAEELLSGSADPLGWFQVELERLTGINVLNYPFDKEHGYSVIKKDKVELLLLTTEKLNQNESVIGNFVGINDFHLISTNIGKKKVTKYFYNSIKGDLRFSDSVLDLYYKKNALMCHLYNDDQLEAFRVKWRA